METHEDLLFYFYIACGIGAGAVSLLFILVAVLFVKVYRLAEDGAPARRKESEKVDDAWQLQRIDIFAFPPSNQLNRQTNMMAEFCYTNPTIVPGELLSRRGFSMYSGTDNHNDNFGIKNQDVQYGTYHEARSKF